MANFSFIFFFFAHLLLLLPIFTGAADPDPVQDLCVANLNSTNPINGFPCRLASSLSSSDFFFSGLAKEGSLNGFNFSVSSANVLTFPALNTHGLSMNRVVIASGGINPIHTHPRATEAGVVIRGTVLVGFFTTDGRYFSKVLRRGEMFVVARGLAHFQENVGDSKAVLITAFNSQLPGVVVFSTTVFGSSEVQDSVVAKSFRVDDSVVKEIRSKFKS